ncbi:MAG: DUF4394 domain-containing protein, partial [Pyrinomonadaceae bacterium]
DQTGTVLNVPIAAVIAPGTFELVMEVFTPDGSVAGHKFFIGSNSDGQTAPGYLSAAACSFPNPTNLDTVGFPDMNIIFNVNGSCPAPTPTPTPTPASGPQIYAYSFNNDHLISFNAGGPSALLSDVALTGLVTDENLSGMDFRPSNGQLYAVGTSGFPGTDSVVTINLTTGAVTSVVTGTTYTTPDGLFVGVDFNPVADRLRDITDNRSNLRLHPDLGMVVGIDTALAYAAGDPNAGAIPNIVHVAYSNNTPGATQTTLYGIDSTLNTLVRIGSINGTPDPPDTGKVFTVGLLGINPTNFGGFDIQQGTDVAYASLNLSSIPNLCKINLTTGAATVVGPIGPSGTIVDGLSLQFKPNGVSVSGRVFTPDGRGLSNSKVTIRSSQGVTRSVTTSSFGFYSFDNVALGNGYLLKVASKQYLFSSQTIQVGDTLTNIDFTGAD